MTWVYATRIAESVWSSTQTTSLAIIVAKRFTDIFRPSPTEVALETGSQLILRAVGGDVPATDWQTTACGRISPSFVARFVNISGTNCQLFCQPTSSAGAKISRNLSDTETSQYPVFNIMAKTDSLQGSLDLLVLKILSRRPRLHGYAIMSAIKESSGDVLRADEGSLYPALHRMEGNRWIRAEWITKDTGRRARIYELTAAGKKQLADEESRWHAVTSAVNRVLRTV